MPETRGAEEHDGFTVEPFDPDLHGHLLNGRAGPADEQPARPEPAEVNR